MRRPPRPRERGIALLIVLWIFMLLGVIALDFARFMRDDAQAAVNFAEETQAYYMALAGMNETIFVADLVREKTGANANPGGKINPAGTAADTADDESLDEIPADAQWHDGEFGGGKYSVRMTDLQGMIAINSSEFKDDARRDFLKMIVTNLVQGGSGNGMGGTGMKGQDRRTGNEIDTIVDSILDWRDGDENRHAHGAESSYYLKRRPPYRAKDGMLDSPEEFLLIRGVTPALFYGHDGIPGLRDVFTVYPRKVPFHIHLNAAPIPVLQALLGVDADTAAEMANDRDTLGPTSPEFLNRITALASAVGATGNGIAEVFTQDTADNEPRYVLLEGKADTQATRNQSNVAAILDLSGEESAEGARVFQWLDRAPWSGAILPGGSARAEG